MNEIHETIDLMTTTDNSTADSTTLESSTTDSGADSGSIESISTTCKSQKGESKYHTLRAVQETRESMKRRLDLYNEKYVSKSIESGRGFIKGLNKDPLKKIDEMISSSTKAAKNLRSDSVKKYDELKDKTKEFTEKVKKSPFKMMGSIASQAKSDTTRKFEEYRASRRKIVENIEKDAEIVKKDILDAGKKVIDKIAVKRSIEEKIGRTVQKLPSMLNLPSKKEVEELIKGIDSVSRKVDSLAGQSVTA